MKKHQCKIYILFDKQGIVNYVGRTARNVTLRLYDHRSKLGYMPKFKIVARCSSNCREIERRWIEHYRDLGFKLRNINWGQGPHFLPASSRKKLSLAFTGRPVTWGAKISMSQKGQPRNWTRSGLIKQKRTRFKKGHKTWSKLPKQQKALFSKRAISQWKNPELRRRMSAGHKLGAWSAMTPRKRKLRALRISIALKANPRIHEVAKMGARALQKKHPRQMSKMAKKFWNDLRKDPIAYRKYIKRRTKAILRAKKGID